MSKKAIIHTLGCRLNQADTALMAGRLAAAGWTLAEPGSNQDIELIIINSCTVTAAAARKSRQALRKLRGKYPNAKIAVTGCSAKIEPQLWEDENVDFIFGNEGKKQLLEIIDGCLIPENKDFEYPDVFTEQTASAFPFRTRAFLKIQEGCNNFCSYCIVPYARGRERSRAYAEVMRDFRHLIDAGFKEIVLTGVNVCAYCDAGRDLATLLTELCAVKGDFRIRLSSTEPHENNRQLIDVMRGNPKICRFLHLSLQHGSNTILKAMNRRYLREEYADFVAYARAAVEGIHIGTDLIVGFPGESNENFHDMCDFVRRIGFANIHVFSYSRRKGTPAATMPNQVPGAVIRERAALLSQLALEQQCRFIESQRGCLLQVLFEQQTADGIYSGWSDNYIRLSKKSPENLIGKFDKCRLK